MTPNFDQSWAGVAPGLFSVTSAAQLAAASAALEYVPAMLAELGTPVTPVGVVQARAFAGVAADGRSLAGLLRSPVVRAKAATRTRVVVDKVDGGTVRTLVPGRSPEQALAEGGRWLDGLLQSAVTDAGRGATQAAIAARPGVGFVRRVNPPCCGRCAVLAGRWYRYDAGFKRHLQCDCVIEPAKQSDAHMLITDPDDLFDNDLVHGLTKRERAALDAGESRNRVINTSRNMWRARAVEQRATTSGSPTGQRDAMARQGLEDIFADARNRIDALAAMRAAGFLQ